MALEHKEILMEALELIHLSKIEIDSSSCSNKIELFDYEEACKCLFKTKNLIKKYSVCE